MTPLLDIKKLYAGYGKITVLWGIDLYVIEGEIVTLLGANGAGKSTLLRSVMGLVPTKGAIYFRGQDLSKVKPWDRAKLGIAYVPEGAQVFPELTVKQNLLLGGYLVRQQKGKIAALLKDVFELFPVLEERKNQRAGTLSGGERQMLAIGRALMSDPVFLLVDEITIGLMPILVPKIFETLYLLREQKQVSILFAEQNATQALMVADRGYVLENGHVTVSGKASELRENPDVKIAYLGV